MSGYGRATVRLVAIVLSLLAACVEGPTGPGSQPPARVRVVVLLPAVTPAAWQPAGDTLRLVIRRAGRVTPILETAAATDSLAADVVVPLEQAVERFVVTAQLDYAGQVMFLAFEALQLRAGLDTMITLSTLYVGPGGAAATLTAVAGDSTLEAGDTTRVLPSAFDSAGQILGRVPVRFLSLRPDLFLVDTIGLVTAQDGAPDSALVAVVMPTGLTASLPLWLVQPLYAATVTIGGDIATPVPIDSTRQLTASALDQFGAPITPTEGYVWTALDPATATVDSTGLVTGVAAGNARITLVSGIADPDTADLTVQAVPTAVARTWIGGAAAGPSDWSVATNWNPTGVPGPSDTAVIAAAINPPILTSAVAVGGARIIGGTLTLDGHSMLVSGDFSTEDGTGTLTMRQPGDVLAVVGHAVFQGGPTSGLLTDGTIYVGGNFEQRNSAGGAATFQAWGNHRTVLNGSAAQQLVPEGDLMFGHLEIANTGGGVTASLETNIEIEGTFTITTATAFDGGDNTLDVEGAVFAVAGCTLSVLELRLFSTLDVGGTFDVALVDFAGDDQPIPDTLAYQDVLITQTARLIGATTIAGSLRIDQDTDANLTLDGHTLVVSTLDVGGFEQQGTLTMQNPLDVVIVQGDATFQGDPTAGLLTNGILYVGGTFRYARAGAFDGSGNHRLVFDGTGLQQALFTESQATLNHLEIANTGAGVEITTTEETVEITLGGELRISGPTTLTGEFADLDVADSVVTHPGSTLDLYGLEMRGGLAIAGALRVRNAAFAGTAQDIPAQGVLENVEISGTARLVAPMTFPGFVLVRGDGANLTLNGQRLDVGSFTTGGAGFPTGTLTMTDAADSLVVTNDASFSGASTTGLLNTGTLFVSGGFYQAEDPSAFQPSGTHRTVLNGAAQQIVSFANPGTGGAASGFHHLDLAKTGGEVWLRTAAAAAGELRADAALTQLVTGPGAMLGVGGVDVNGLTLDGIALAIGSGTITQFDDVTFRNQNTAAVQLTIEHPGSASRFTFTDVQFLTVPGSGAYVSATDVAPGDGNVLTIDLMNTIPPDGSAFTLTNGGAVVTWPGGPPQAGSFGPTGSMNASHTGGGAAVLDDGTVLVVGGPSTGGDRYNPTSSVFSPTPGSMMLFREGLTVTELPDGRVLVTGGGQVAPATTRTAELFDPTTGMFALTDSLGDAVPASSRGRRYHTATLLTNGQVLVVGGEGVTAQSQLYRLASAETYDHTTETFTVRNNPARARSRHAMVRLNDGRVLVIGGRTNFNDFSDVVNEVFDPTSGNWGGTGSLTTGRNGHTATLLADGRVLVTGGSDSRDDANRRLASAELYDPTMGTFTPTGSMAVRRQYHFAVLLADGKVLVGGGRDETNAFPVAAELYDPTTGMFTTVGDMLFGGERMVAIALPDGRVLIAAGTAAQVYNP